MDEKQIKESLKKFLEEKSKELGDDVKFGGIISVGNKRELLDLVEEIARSSGSREDGDRIKVLECLPCLAKTFARIYARLRGDPIAYTGALTVSLLNCVMRLDASSNGRQYCDGLTLTLLKFAELMDLLDEPELKRISAREYMDRGQTHEF